MLTSQPVTWSNKQQPKTWHQVFHSSDTSNLSFSRSSKHHSCNSRSKYSDWKNLTTHSNTFLWTINHTTSHKLDSVEVEFPPQTKPLRVQFCLLWRSHDHVHQSEPWTHIRYHFLFQAQLDHRQNCTPSNFLKESEEWLRTKKWGWCLSLSDLNTPSYEKVKVAESYWRPKLRRNQSCSVAVCHCG